MSENIQIEIGGPFAYENGAKTIQVSIFVQNVCYNSFLGCRFMVGEGNLLSNIQICILV